jgi:hypothetical protein
LEIISGEAAPAGHWKILGLRFRLQFQSIRDPVVGPLFFGIYSQPSSEESGKIRRNPLNRVSFEGTHSLSTRALVTKMTNSLAEESSKVADERRRLD